MKWVIFTFLLSNLPVYATPETDCAFPDELNSDDLAKNCRLQLCERPLEIPSTEAELSQLRQQNNLPAFNGVTTPLLKKSMGLLQKLSDMSSIGMIDNLISKPDTEAELFSALASKLIKQNEDGTYVFSDQSTLSEETKVALTAPLAQFSKNLGSMQAVLNSINSDNGIGIGKAYDIAFGPEASETKALAEFLNSYTPEMGVSPEDFQRMKTWVMEGSKKPSKSERESFNQTVRAMASYPVRSNRAPFEALAQEILTSLKLTVQALTEQSKLRCNVKDYYNQRSAQLAKSGVLKEWTNELQDGINSSLLQILPKNSQNTFQDFKKQCRVSIETPNTKSPVVVQAGLGIMGDVVGVMSEIQNCTESFTDRASRDFFDSSEKAEIVISAATVVYSGKQILSHEVGHCLQKKLEEVTDPAFQTKFRDLKNCLISNQGGKSDYFSEDFADWFGAKVSKDTPNLGCVLMDIVKSEPTLTPDRGDPHSSELFRALHVHTVQGKTIPGSCKTLMTKENREIRKCGW